MEKNEIEKLIEDKIKDVKLDLWQNWFKIFLSFGGAIIVIFGLILPLWTRMDVLDRADKAIQDMKREFEKLAGTQLREPELEVFLDGQKLEGQTLTSEKRYNFIITNIGDARAENIAVRIYCNSKINLRSGDWYPSELRDEDQYSQVNELEYPPNYLTPKNLFSFSFQIFIKKDIEMKSPVRALLKILYNKPQPKRISFWLFKDNKK